MNLLQEEWNRRSEEDGDQAILLDVRTEEEFNQGRIPGAINIDIYKGQGFIYKVEELDKTKKYYVYCKAGGRSQQACSIMQELGFDSAYNLVGGIIEWRGKIEK